MKAVLLVGGEGTRMRPLTETIPKPLLPLVDRPFLDHLLRRLSASDVDEVILSSPYLQEAFTGFLRAHSGPPAITWVTEQTPLGTGGAVANAAREINQAFLVMNGDILTDLDIGELVEAHRSSGAVATIALTPVEDARPFGLVALGDGGLVREFREKPQEAVPGVINAGTYVLDPGALRRVDPGEPVSIERETFPELIEAGESVFGFVSSAYWIDVGTPEKYLRATFDALDGRIEGLEYEAPWVHPAADVDLRARLGRWVVAGEGVRIEGEAQVEDSVLMDGASIGGGAVARDCIIGPHATVGAAATLTGVVLAEGASAPEGITADGARVGAGRNLEP